MLDNKNYFSEEEEYKDVKSDIDLIENLYNFLNKENNKISEDIHEKIDLIASKECYELYNIKNDINELKNFIINPNIELTQDLNFNNLRELVKSI